jgi:hypothetical protein
MCPELYFCYNCEREHCAIPIFNSPSKLSQSRRGITTTINRSPSQSKGANKDLELKDTNKSSDQRVLIENQKEKQQNIHETKTELISKMIY